MDTSFLVPLYMLEPTSSQVEAFLNRELPRNIVVSSWTRTEFASSLARNVRMKLQAEGDARVLMEHFDQDVGSSFYPYTPTAEDFDLATSLILASPTSGLRGADALHLAAAKNQSFSLYTLDQTLLRAAEAFGVAASDAGIGAR